MISDILLSRWKEEWRGWAAFAGAFLGLGLLAYFEKGSLEEAIFYPLTLLMFIVFVIVICDLLICLFRGYKVGKSFIVFFISSIFFVLISFFYSGVRATIFLLSVSFLVALIFLAFGKFISMQKK